MLRRADAACAAHRAGVLTLDLPREWPPRVIDTRTVQPEPLGRLACQAPGPFIAETSAHEYGRTLKVARSSFIHQRLASSVAAPHAHPCAGPHGLNSALPLRPVLAASPRHFTVGSPGGAFLAMWAAISRRRLAVVMPC